MSTTFGPHIDSNEILMQIMAETVQQINPPSPGGEAHSEMADTIDEAACMPDHTILRLERSFTTPSIPTYGLSTASTIEAAEYLEFASQDSPSSPGSIEDEDDVTTINGTSTKNLMPSIIAPSHLTEEEKTRFHELAKFCPTTLLGKDCVHYDRCSLIQPCRKFSSHKWNNFCHHGTRCHNSHKVAYTCRSLFYDDQCVEQDCKYSHDKTVRLAMEGFRNTHEMGKYGVE